MYFVRGVDLEINHRRGHSLIVGPASRVKTKFANPIFWTTQPILAKMAMHLLGTEIK